MIDNTARMQPPLALSKKLQTLAGGIQGGVYKSRPVSARAAGETSDQHQSFRSGAKGPTGSLRQSYCLTHDSALRELAGKFMDLIACDHAAAAAAGQTCTGC